MILQLGIRAVPSVAIIFASQEPLSNHPLHAARGLTTVSFEPMNILSISAPYYHALVSSLSKVHEIEAVFVATDEDGICHVYSVVDQHNPEVALKIMTQEDKIQELFPTMLFNFRVRAAQGRTSSQAVPIHSQPLFIR
jgi:hypothetical protein